jgi:hypothetical protein
LKRSTRPVTSDRDPNVGPAMVTVRWIGEREKSVAVVHKWKRKKYYYIRCVFDN